MVQPQVVDGNVNQGLRWLTVMSTRGLRGLRWLTVMSTGVLGG